MEEILSIENIVFAIGMLGVIFSIYHYFKNPQIAGDKRDALIAQQVQWQIEGTDRKFKDLQDSFQGLLLQSNNHIHTVETKVDSVNNTVCNLQNEVVKLTTIIDERIPKK